MLSCTTLVSVATAALLSFASTSNAAGFSSANNVAVYWGQNSYGQGSGALAQQTLATYCANSNVDIIPMAFLYKMTSGPGKQPVLNFANQQCGTVFSNTNLIHCPSITQDIKTCQSKYNKTILLSIGGSAYNEGGFADSSTAVAWADQIWYMFGPKKSGSSYLRPFDDAIVDGFDLDFEMTVKNMQPFAARLRSQINSYASKKMYLTAAPQCPYPDAASNSMLNGGVSFDAVFVQFYNNYCGLQSYDASASTQNNFNFATWDKWAKSGSANKNVKIFLGVPAGSSAAGSGYQPLSKLTPIIRYSQKFTSFGGVMMWDASQAFANTGFLAGVKSAVKTTAKRSIEWRA